MPGFGGRTKIGGAGALSPVSVQILCVVGIGPHNAIGKDAYIALVLPAKELKADGQGTIGFSSGDGDAVHRAAALAVEDCHHFVAVGAGGADAGIAGAGAAVSAVAAMDRGRVGDCHVSLAHKDPLRLRTMPCKRSWRKLMRMLCVPHYPS